MGEERRRDKRTPKKTAWKKSHAKLVHSKILVGYMTTRGNGGPSVGRPQRTNESEKSMGGWGPPDE